MRGLSLPFYLSDAVLLFFLLIGCGKIGDLGISQRFVATAKAPPPLKLFFFASGGPFLLFLFLSLRSAFPFSALCGIIGISNFGPQGLVRFELWHLPLCSLNNPRLNWRTFFFRNGRISGYCKFR